MKYLPFIWISRFNIYHGISPQGNPFQISTLSRVPRDGLVFCLDHLPKMEFHFSLFLVQVGRLFLNGRTLSNFIVIFLNPLISLFYW